jgi:hypothetical protein
VHEVLILEAGKNYKFIEPAGNNVIRDAIVSGGKDAGRCGSDGLNRACLCGPMVATGMARLLDAS